MAKLKKTPLRMCIACHEMKPKKEMLRIVKNQLEEISLDYTGKAAGRGAYICNNIDCIKKLNKYKLLNKTFSCEVSKEIYLKIEEEFLGRK